MCLGALASVLGSGSWRGVLIGCAGAVCVCKPWHCVGAWYRAAVTVSSALTPRACSRLSHVTVPALHKMCVSRAALSMAHAQRTCTQRLLPARTHAPIRACYNPSTEKWHISCILRASVKQLVALPPVTWERGRRECRRASLIFREEILHLHNFISRQAALLCITWKILTSPNCRDQSDCTCLMTYMHVIPHFSARAVNDIFPSYIRCWLCAHTEDPPQNRKSIEMDASPGKYYDY